MFLLNTVTLQDRIEEIEFKYENLERIVSLVDEYSKHIMTQTFTILGIVVAVSTAILIAASYFMIRNMINDKLNKEIDKRMLNLLKNNPTIYHAVGSAIPDAKNKIYLNSSIPGTDQLIPDKVLIFEVSCEGSAWINLTGGLIPLLRLNENGIVEIEIPNYHRDHGLIQWKILWSRNEYS